MTEASPQVPKATPPTTESGGGFNTSIGWTATIVLSFVGMLLVQEYVALSYTTVSIALPSITAQFASAQGGWLLTGFILTGAVMSPLLGRMADIYGKRRILLLVLGVAGFGAIMAALAPTMGVLIAGRCVEGLSVAGMFLSYSLMRDIFPRRILPLAVSLSVTGTGIFGVFLPLLVGVLLEKVGFRGLFWVDVAIIAVLFVLIRATTPETPLRKPATLDVLGGLLLGGGIALVLVGISQGQAWGWTSVGVIAFVVAGLLVLAAFVAWVRRHRDPVVDLRMFARRPILMAAVLAALAYASNTLASAALPLISMTPPGNGYGLGLSPTTYAAVATPFFLSITIGGFFVGRYVARSGGRRWMIIGGTSFTVSGIALVFFHNTIPQMLVVAVLAGIGAGTSMAAIPNLVVGYAPAEEQGSIAGNVQIAMSSFASIAPVAMFAILAGSATMTARGPVYAERGYQDVALLMAALSALSLLLLFTVFSTSKLRRSVRSATAQTDRSA